MADNISFEELDTKLKSGESYRYISVIMSNIGELPESLLKHKELKTLILSGISLRDLPVWIQQFPELSSLDLSYNHNLNIDTTLKRLAGIPGLEELGLRENQLDRIPGSIHRLKKLKALNVSGNQMRVLPIEFSRMENLERLSLDACKNLDVNEVIQVLDAESIRYLSFYKTNIRELPNSIVQLKNLEELWLNYTGIQKLPTEFVFKKLRVLGLAGNSIREIPDSFAGNRSLERLLFTGNELEAGKIAELRRQMPQTVILF